MGKTPLQNYCSKKTCRKDVKRPKEKVIIRILKLETTTISIIFFGPNKYFDQIYAKSIPFGFKHY